MCNEGLEGSGRKRGKTKVRILRGRRGTLNEETVNSIRHDSDFPKTRFAFGAWQLTGIRTLVLDGGRPILVPEQGVPRPVRAMHAHV